jgi:large subunit ribosomal protein L13
MNTTYSTKKSDIKRQWHLIDAADKTLGRMATEIAGLLIGKHKVNLVKHLDCGDYVVVTNAKQVSISGRKAKQKIYYSHSNYPGGFKEITFEKLMAKDPRKIIVHAVKGMLPKNSLQARFLKRLRVYIDNQHPYADKLAK